MQLQMPKDKGLGDRLTASCKINCVALFGPVAQWIRALVYEAWGCRFESYLGHDKGFVSVVSFSSAYRRGDKK